VPRGRAISAACFFWALIAEGIAARTVLGAVWWAEWSARRSEQMRALRGYDISAASSVRRISTAEVAQRMMGGAVWTAALFAGCSERWR